MNKDDILYGQLDDEVLCSSIDDWVNQFLDQVRDCAPRTVEVAEWERVKVDPGTFHNELLEFLDERLWESDYGFGLDESPELSKIPKLRELERAFLAVALDEFVPWVCEPNGKKHVIDLWEWAVAHGEAGDIIWVDLGDDE